MKKIALCGLGNALVDLFVDISDSQFGKLNFEKGTMRLVSAEEQGSLLAELHAQKPRMVSGGSVANSVVAFSQLGGKAAFLSSIAKDSLGEFYRDEFKSLGIAFPSKATSALPTGTCVALITPDAERTMRTCLGATSELGVAHLDEQTIAESEWLFIEGYVLSNPDSGQAAVRQSIQFAKKHGTKIALTCSEAWVIEGFRDAVNETIANCDLVFANHAESVALTGAASAELAFKTLSKSLNNVVVTMGADGAWCKWNGSEKLIASVACTPRDLTGAGDMFAGAFLAGVLGGKNIQDAGSNAALLASRVISQVGARLENVS